MTDQMARHGTSPARRLRLKNGARRAVLVAAVLLLEVALTVGLILLSRLVARDVSAFAAAVFLVLGAIALSVLAHVLLSKGLIGRLQAQQSALVAEKVARGRAEATIQEKSRMLATMSHEIRTPLNGVIGMLGLLRESQLSAEQQNYVQTAYGSARTLLSFIDEILDVAKAEAEQQSGARKVDLVALTENVTELLAPRAHAKGIDICCTVAPDLPPDVMVNDMRLRQVMFNLAGNAIKFTHTGGVAISLSRNDRSLVLQVRDTGIGLSPEEQARLFKPFVQANERTQQRYGGTGLGLVITQEVVHSMGGTLHLTSTPGEGSCFTAVFPDLLDDIAPAAPLPLVGRSYCIVMSDAFTAQHLVEQLRHLGATVRRQTDFRSPALHGLIRQQAETLVVDSVVGQEIRAWLGDPDWGACAQVWVVLTPEERQHRKALMGKPFAGYLMKPVRRSTLAGRLAEGDPALLQTAAETLKRVQTPGASGGLRLLLVDDTPVNCFITRTILQKAGHNVTTATSGQEALDLLTTHHRFDLMLLDMEMPGLSGPETARLLRHRERAEGRSRLPILALTANTRPEAVAACLEAGMDGHLCKPFDHQDLHDAIARLLRKAA